MKASHKMRIAFKSYGRASRFIRKNNLWHFVYIPGIVNIILFYFSFQWFVNSASEWITGIFNLDCDNAYYSWLCITVVSAAGILEFVTKWFLYITFIGIYFSVYKSLLLIIYSPILAYLVEIVDKNYRGINEPFSLRILVKDTMRGIIFALRCLFVESLAIFTLFIVAFLPIINIIQPFLLWLVSAYFIGVSMLDYTLEKKGMNVRESIHFCKKNKLLAAGMGFVFQLIFLIPFLGWMIAPTYGVIAAYFAVEEIENINN